MSHFDPASTRRAQGHPSFRRVGPNSRQTSFSKHHQYPYLAPSVLVSLSRVFFADIATTDDASANARRRTRGLPRYYVGRRRDGDSLLSRPTLLGIPSCFMTTGLHNDVRRGTTISRFDGGAHKLLWRPRPRSSFGLRRASVYVSSYDDDSAVWTRVLLFALVTLPSRFSYRSFHIGRSLVVYLGTNMVEATIRRDLATTDVRPHCHHDGAMFGSTL